MCRVNIAISETLHAVPNFGYHFGMAKNPTRKRPKKSEARTAGRPKMGERVQVAARYPPVVLDGIKRQAAIDGISLNDAYIKAGLNYGDFPDGRPKVSIEKRSVAAKVTTSQPDPIKPGDRLDKKSIGARVGPKIVKGAAPVAAPREEEAV